MDMKLESVSGHKKMKKIYLNQASLKFTKMQNGSWSKLNEPIGLVEKQYNVNFICFMGGCH